MNTYNQTCPCCLRSLEEWQDIVEIEGELIHRQCRGSLSRESTMDGQEAMSRLSRENEWRGRRSGLGSEHRARMSRIGERIEE